MIEVLRRKTPWPDATVVIMRWCGRAAPRRWRSSRSPSGSTRIEGKTIAFLWDDLFRGDEIWPILKQELGKRFTGVSFVDHDAFGSTHGDEEHRVLGELPGKIKSMNIDAVVSGMGC